MGFKGSVYIAGPLFSLAERTFIEDLAGALSARMPEASLILPHRYAATVVGLPDFADRVFEWCLRSAAAADVMVVILDGADADSGTCIEMGSVYPRVPIVGIRTDFRALEDRGLNLMVSKLCTELIWLPDQSVTVEALAERVSEALARIGEG